MAIEDAFYEYFYDDLEGLDKEFWADESLLRYSNYELLRKYEFLLAALDAAWYLALLPMVSVYCRVKRHMKKVQEKIELVNIRKGALHRKELPVERQYE